MMAKDQSTGSARRWRATRPARRSSGCGQAAKAGYDVGGHDNLNAARRPATRSTTRASSLLRHKGLTMGKSWEPSDWMGTASRPGHALSPSSARRSR